MLIALLAAWWSGQAHAAATECDLNDAILGSVPGYDTVPIGPELDPERHAEFIASEQYDGPVAMRRFVLPPYPAATTIVMLDAGTAEGAAGVPRANRRGLTQALGAWQDVHEESFEAPTSAAWGVVADGVDESGAPMRYFAVSGAAGRIGIFIGTVGGSETIAATDEEIAFISTLYEEQVDRLPAECSKDAPGPNVADELASFAGATVAIWAIIQGSISLLAGWSDAPTRRRWHTRLPMVFGREARPGWLPILPGWIVRDVASYANARRGRGRLIALIRLGGVTLIGMSAAASTTGERRLLLLAPAGLVLPPLLERVLRKAPGDVGPEPPRRVPRPRGWAGFGLRSMATLAGILAAIGIVGGLSFIVSTDETEYEQAVAATRAGWATPDTYANFIAILGLIGLGALVCAGALWRLARRATAPSLRSVRAADPRPPVLFLRGFADDALRMYVTNAERREWLARLSLRRTESFEEVVAWTLSAYGPVVAIADPKSHHRRLGAARESIEVDDWLSVVRARMHEASTIVLIIGESTGLVAEIVALRDEGLLERCVFILPPLDGWVVASRWGAVASALGLGKRIDERDTGSVLVRLTESHDLLYRSSARDDVGYQTSLDLALAESARMGKKGAAFAARYSAGSPVDRRASLQGSPETSTTTP